MNRSLGWLGLGVVLGALVWPSLEPGPLGLLAGLLGIVTLCCTAPSGRTALLAWSTGGLLLGALSTSLQVGPIPSEARALLQGEVVGLQGSWARVQTAQGQARIRMGLKPPRVGTRLALWTRPRAPDVVLPGARDRTPNDRRRRLVNLRVRDWVVLGPEPEPKPEIWAAVPQGGLLKALSTGDRSQVRPEVKDLMRQTGTIHLMAISGLHVGLVSLGVAGLVGLIARPLVLLGWVWAPRWLAMIAASGTAWAYGTSVGWPASAQRAGWVVAAALLARAIGRRGDAWNALGLAAAVVVLSDPGQVGQIGFQLSFGAVAGILLWSPKISALGSDSLGRVWRWAWTGMGITVGAVIGTLPVLAWDFQQLAPVGVIANLVATPLIGTIGVPAALISAHGPDWLAQPALQIGNAACELAIAMLEQLAMPLQTPAVGPIAGLGLLAAMLMPRRPIWAAGLAIACLAPAAPPQNLVVSFPAVGQGTAALVQWPDGRTWLIDGGPPSDRLLRWLRRQGIRHIDTVVLSHAHPDHMGGLIPVLEELSVETLWAPERPRQDGGTFFQMWRDASQRGVLLKVAGDPGLALLHPPPDWEPKPRRRVNERSIVLRISHGQHSFLFTGDIQAEAEARLVSMLPQTTVVQVPHHGSRSSSGQALVDATDPLWAVFTLGQDNRFGHPAPEVLARWRPARSLRTDIDGTIRFESDGHKLTLSRWRAGEGWQALDRGCLRPSC